MKRFLWIGVDVCIFVVAAVVATLLEVGVIEPYHRGFFCDDNTIRYPYKGNTVSSALDGVLCFFLPLAMMLIGTLVVSRRWRHNDDRKELLTPCCPIRIRRVFRLLISQAFYFTYGFALTALFTTTGKYAVGRLRPNFIAVCKPDYSRINCTDAQGNYLYVGDASVCTGNPKDVTESRLSWPSGHSSITTFAATYMILYLEATEINVVSKALKVILEVIVALLGFLVCLSRLTDNKHHWSDILSGAILGGAIAIYTVMRLLGHFKFFRLPNEESQPIRSDDDNSGGSTSSRQRKEDYGINDATETHVN